jgi:hypothetical protein
MPAAFLLPRGAWAAPVSAIAAVKAQTYRRPFPQKSRPAAGASLPASAKLNTDVAGYIVKYF